MKPASLAIRTFVASLLLAWPASSSAQEIYQFYTGARQLAMGGAYVNVVNDETAVLTNPAGLGKLRDVTFTIADPELHGSFNDTEIANANNFSQMMQIQKLYEALNEKRNKHFHAKAQVFPSVVTPNFGLGLHAKWSYDAMVNSAGNVYRLDYTNDYAVAMGFCFRFWDGIIKLGAAGRLVNRVEIHKNIAVPPAEEMTVANQASEGMGLASDVGMIITIPIVWLPALGATVRDVGNTNYGLRSGMIYTTATRPQETKQKIDVAYSISPIISNRIRMSITAQVNDINTLSEELDKMKRVHAGLEINFADFFFLRGGMNQRYWTAGVELATERFQFQATSYGEEIGNATAEPVTYLEDRRWVGKFAIRF